MSNPQLNPCSTAPAATAGHQQLKRAVRLGFTADAKLAGYHVVVSDSHIVKPGPYRQDQTIVQMKPCSL